MRSLKTLSEIRFFVGDCVEDATEGGVDSCVGDSVDESPSSAFLSRRSGLCKDCIPSMMDSKSISNSCLSPLLICLSTVLIIAANCPSSMLLSTVITFPSSNLLSSATSGWIHCENFIICGCAAWTLFSFLSFLSSFFDFLSVSGCVGGDVGCRGGVRRSSGLLPDGIDVRFS